MTTRTKEDLLGFSACDGMTDEQLTRLYDAMVWREYAAGERLFSGGEPATHMFFVFDGSVSINMRSDGREEVLAVLGPQSIVGEMGAVLDQPRSASATAMTEVVTGVIDRETLAAWIEERSHVAMVLTLNILKVMAVRIRRVNAKLFELGKSEQVGPKVRAELAEFRQKLFTTWSF